MYGGAREASVNDKQIAILHSASSRGAKSHRGGHSTFKLAAPGEFNILVPPRRPRALSSSNVYVAATDLNRLKIRAVSVHSLK